MMGIRCVLWALVLFLLTSLSVAQAQVVDTTSPGHCLGKMLSVLQFMAAESKSQETDLQILYEIEEFQKVYYRFLNRAIEKQDSADIAFLKKLGGDIDQLKKNSDQVLDELASHEGRNRTAALEDLQRQLSIFQDKLADYSSTSDFDQILEQPSLLVEGAPYRLPLPGRDLPLDIVFSNGVVEKMREVNINMVQKFLRAMKNGFVPKHGAQGIYYFSGLPNVRGVKIKGDFGQYRLYGCYAHGVFTFKLLLRKEKAGAEVKIKRKLANLCL